MRYLRATTAIAHFCFALLFVLAILFFRERLFVDSSYYIARVINSKGFWVEHNRYILAFSQWLPLVGIYLGLNLKKILILYSVGHVLFFYIIFLLARYKFNDPNAGIFLIALQLIGICYGWFTPMFELYYGCALLVLVNSMLNTYLYEKSLLLAICLVSFLALMSHPFVIFLFCFMLLYSFRKKILADRNTWMCIAITLIIAIAIKFLHSSDYEKDKTATMLETFHANSFGFHYLLSLFLFLCKYYWDVLLLIIISCWQLYQRKKTREIFTFLLFFLPILFLINLVNYGFDHSRYQEQAYFPIVFLSLYIFVSATPSFSGWSVLLPSLIVVRLIILLAVSGKFTARVEKMNELIYLATQQGGSKFYVPDELLPKGEMDPTNWSYPIEMLLLSSAQYPVSASICTHEDYEWNGNNDKLDENNFLFRRWEILPDTAVNRACFHIQKGLYKPLNSGP